MWFLWSDFWTKIRVGPSLKLTASLHLKMDGWNTIVSFWGVQAYFQVRTVSFREDILLMAKIEVCRSSDSVHSRKLTAGGPQNDGLWKRYFPLKMAIVGKYVRFLGCKMNFPSQFCLICLMDSYVQQYEVIRPFFSKISSPKRPGIFCQETIPLASLLVTFLGW